MSLFGSSNDWSTHVNPAPAMITEDIATGGMQMDPPRRIIIDCICIGVRRQVWPIIETCYGSYDASRNFMQWRGVWRLFGSGALDEHDAYQAEGDALPLDKYLDQRQQGNAGTRSSSGKQEVCDALTKIIPEVCTPFTRLGISLMRSKCQCM